MRLKDKVIIITGAGQGIGTVFADKMSQEGAKIIIADINSINGQEIAKNIRNKGGEAFFFQTDVTDEMSVQSMVNKVTDKFNKIDVLINNASLFSIIKMKPIEEIEYKEWQKVMNVNVGGVFICSKAVLKDMKRQKYGSIINISSAAVLMGRPFYIHYVSSKAAVLGFTRALAKEVGNWSITVNSITPGSTKTEIPRETASPEQIQAMVNQRCIKREQVPEDLCGAVIFLASDESRFISGQNINIDGGLTLY